MNNYTDKIDQLVTQYNFEELNSDEQAMIRSQLGESEYNQMREIVAGAKNLFSPPIPAVMHQQMNETLAANKRPATKAKTWGLSVLGFLLGTITTSSYFLANNSAPIPETTLEIVQDTVYIHQTDTLIQTITPQPKIIIQEVRKYKESESATYPESQSKPIVIGPDLQQVYPNNTCLLYTSPSPRDRG